MNTRTFIRCFGAIVAASLALLPEPLWACAVCNGDPNSSMTQGINAAVLGMIGVTAVVLGGFIALIVALNIRARRHRAILEAAANPLEGIQS
jgi:hypothetical protein